MLHEEDVMSSLLEAGYNKCFNKIILTDRSDIISTLISFHLFLKVKAMMDQFREGLEISGLMYFMGKYTSLLRPLLTDESRPLTARKCREHSINEHV